MPDAPLPARAAHRRSPDPRAGHPAQHPARLSPRPDRPARIRPTPPPALTTPRPPVAGAPLLPVQVTALQPLVPQRDWQAYLQHFTAHAQAARSAPARLNAALARHLHTLEPGCPLPPSTALGDLLDHLAPLPGFDVVGTTDDGHLSLTLSPHMGHAVHLHDLAHHLRKVRGVPDLLPNLVQMIEDLTSGVAPCAGPRTAEAVAERHWNTDFLAECIMERADLPADADLSDRDVIRYARRLGLDHPGDVRRRTPFAYFRRSLPDPGVLDRVRQEAADPTLGPLWAQLENALQALVHARAALSEPTAEEAQDQLALSTLRHILVVDHPVHSPTFEVCDDYMQYVMQGSEPEPVNVVHAQPTTPSLRRLLQALRASHAILSHGDQVCTLLAQLDALCPERNANGALTAPHPGPG